MFQDKKHYYRVYATKPVRNLFLEKYCTYEELMNRIYLEISKWGGSLDSVEVEKFERCNIDTVALEQLYSIYAEDNLMISYVPGTSKTLEFLGVYMENHPYIKQWHIVPSEDAKTQGHSNNG